MKAVAKNNVYSFRCTPDTLKYVETKTKNHDIYLHTVQEVQSILPFARRSVNSVKGFTMVVYEKIFGSINR